MPMTISSVLSTESFPVGTAITNTYLGSKLVEVGDSNVSPSETHTFTYDASYRVVSETQGPRGTLAFTYTPADRRASYAVAGGARAAHSFYPDGSLATIQWSPEAGTFKYSYDPRGRTQQITFPSGQHRDYTYDAQGRPGQPANVHPSRGNLRPYPHGYHRDKSGGRQRSLG